MFIWNGMQHVTKKKEYAKKKKKMKKKKSEGEKFLFKIKK